MVKEQLGSKLITVNKTRLMTECKEREQKYIACVKVLFCVIKSMY